MEIHIIERAEGRIDNVEVLDQKTNDLYVLSSIRQAIDGLGFVARFLPGYVSRLEKKIVKNLNSRYVLRLKQNLNR